MTKRKSVFPGSWGLLILPVLFGLSGCLHEEPNLIYMPDMVYSPAISAQQDGSMRMPVKGTVPRGFQPYPYVGQPDEAGKYLKNPLKATKEVLARGKHVFSTHCLVCHGPYGQGDGTIVPPFPRPLSLQSEKVRNYSDGRIFHVIQVGQNLMPSYASQILAGDRWAAIHYIRALQKAKNPTSEDLKVAEQESK